MGAAFGFQSIAENFAVGEIHETVKGGNRLRHRSATLEGETIDIWTARADGFEADLVFALLQRGVGDQIFPARPVACVIEGERFLNNFAINLQGQGPVAAREGVSESELVGCCFVRGYDPFEVLTGLAIEVGISLARKPAIPFIKARSLPTGEGGIQCLRGACQFYRLRFHRLGRGVAAGALV